MRERHFLRYVVPLFLAACGGGEAETGGPAVTRTTLGDTTVVRTLSGSVWGDDVRLVEELSVGVLEGADEYQFGNIMGIAPDPDGGMYVFDSQAPALRYYDADGVYVRTLGRGGQGPGDYGNGAMMLAVRRSDGRVVMRDFQNQRYNVWDPDGSNPESWRVESGVFGFSGAVIDTLDHLYLPTVALTGPPDQTRPLPIVYLHIDDAGRVVDTIPIPTLEGEPTPRTVNFAFGPQKSYTWHPHGGLILGMNTDFRFEVRRPDGTVLRVEKAWEPLPVAGEERTQWEARLDWIRENQGQFIRGDISPVPSEKPAYRGLRAGVDGRIWVHVYTDPVQVEAQPTQAPPGMDPPPPLTWVEPPTFDVFEADGTFLGRVALPVRAQLFATQGDSVWAVRRGDFDEPIVVRYRVEHGSGG